MSATITIECPTCRKPRQVRRRDAHRVRQCRRCHLAQIAPAGYAATRAKYGEHFAARFVRLHRLDNPSSLEQIVSNWLDCQRVCYEREYWLDCGETVYLVDFVFCAAGGVFAVEVQGAWAHSHHVERDRRKLAAMKDCGFVVVELLEAEVLNGAFIKRLEGLVC